MDTVRFNWNGATFAVEPETVGSSVSAEYIVFLIYPTPTQRQYRIGLEVGSFLSTVTLVEGDPVRALGAPIPSLDAPADDIRAFAERFQALPGGLRNAWSAARAALLALAEAPTPAVETDEGHRSDEA